MTADLASILSGSSIQFPEASNPSSIVVGESSALNPVGGVEPYTYTVVSGGGSISDSSTYTAPSSPGVVVIKVTDSAGNSSHFTVNIVPGLTASIATPVIALNNAATVVPQGGIAGYSYSVVSGGGVISASGNYEPQGFMGTATIHISDSANHTFAIDITTNALLQISPANSSIYTMTTQPFSATGGVPPLSYSVLLGGGSIGFSDGLYQASASSGTATVVVSDALGNSSSTQVTIQQGVSLMPTAVTLAVGNTQVFTAGGGPAPYVFEISNGDGVTGAIVSSTGTTVTAEALAVGTFVLRVTDSTPRSFDVLVTVNQALTASASHSTITENNTSTVSGVNGVPPYSYALASGPGSVNATTGVYTPGTGGAGVIVVTDSKGNTSSRTIFVNPAVRIVTLSSVVATGESLSMDVAGGVSPYNFFVVSGAGNLSGWSYIAPANPETLVLRVQDSLGNIDEVSIPVVHRPLISDFQITTSVFQNTAFAQNSLSLSFVASHHTQWCIQFRVSAPDSCTWNSTPLPASTPLEDDGKEIKTFYAWVKNSYGLISAPKSSSVAFNSKFPIGSNLLFDAPVSVTVDGDGFVYTLDWFKGIFRKFSATGEPVLSFGGKGSTNGKFSVPQSGIVRHPSGDIYIYDTGNSCIKVFDSQGNYKFQFGYPGTGPGQLSPLLGAKNGNSIALASDGNILVADTNNHRVQVFTPTGNYLSQFGSLGSADGKFNLPISLTLGSGGDIYVLERGNNRIQRFDSAGVYKSKFGVAGTGDGQISAASAGLAVDSGGNIYVSEHPRVQKFSPAGTFLFKLTVDYVTGLAVDSSDNLYVTVSRDAEGAVRKYSPSGGLLDSFGSASAKLGHFENPEDFATDASGNIYVADTGNHRIQKFDSSGNFILSFGSKGTGNTEFNRPFSITIDSDGNIQVIDLDNNRIKKFTSSGGFISSRSASGLMMIRSDSAGGLYVGSGGWITKTDNDGNYIKDVGAAEKMSVYQDRIYMLSDTGINVYDLAGNTLGSDLDISGTIDVNNVRAMLFNGGYLLVCGSGGAQSNMLHYFYAGDNYLTWHTSMRSLDQNFYGFPFDYQGIVSGNGGILILDRRMSRIVKLESYGGWYLLQ